MRGWGDPEGDPPWNCLLGIEGLYLRAEQVGHKSKIARLLVEDRDKVVGNDVPIGSSKRHGINTITRILATILPRKSVVS